MAGIFSFQSSGLPDSAVLVGFRGREAMNEHHRFHVFVTIPADAGFVPIDALWLKATIAIDRGADGAPHEIHGVVARVTLLLLVAERALYEIVVVPRMHHLAQSRHSRVFTGKKSTEVILATLEASGYQADDRMHGRYEAEEHICQYKESDLDFISRWMEREGIFYFFRHEDGDDALVLGDAPSAYERTDVSVRYHPVVGDDVSAGESFQSFRGRTVASPATVHLADYDPSRPSLDVSAREDVSRVGLGEISLFGARVISPGEAKRIAKVRSEEIRTRETVFQGEGTVFGLRPGHVFALTEHPRAAYDTDYLCTALVHEANIAATTPELIGLLGLPARGVYRARATAIRADVPFRPPRVHGWPRIAGFEAAVVDGPADSDYAQLDDAGRYVVRFHFDEGDMKDGQASTRLRMMQPHAGSPEGFHFPLRKGTEVFVAFLGGDPDRPVIAGAVPNAVTPSPVTSSNGTHNVIHTGGDTHIEMEDLEGKQHIDIETPPETTFVHLGEPHDGHTHYIVENTGGDCHFDIGTNQDINVGGKLTEKVKGMVMETYDTSQDSKITGPQKTTVDKPVIEIYKSTQDTTVTGKVTETHASLHLTATSGDRFENYTDKQTTDVTGPKVEIYASTHDKTVNGNTQQIYSGPVITTVGGAVSHTVSGAVVQVHGPTTSIYQSLQLTCPGTASVFASKWDFVGLQSTFWSSVTDVSKSKKTETVGFYLSLLGIKLEVVGIAIAGNGVKVEAVGCVAAWTTAALNGFGVRLSCNPLHTSARVFKKL